MKTLKQLPIVREVSPSHPNGAIINETATNAGTPVVREVYNDLLVNIYKLLETSGVVSNGIEDSELNGYQILEALKKLANSTNDVEQTLTLSGSVFSFNLDTAFLPNKYLFIAKAGADFVSGAIHTIKGSNVTSSPFLSTGFKIGDEVLVCLDTTGVRAYSLSTIGSTKKEFFTVLGTPLAFNDSTNLYYQEDGFLLSNKPSSVNLESVIRVELSNGTIILQDMFVINNTILCFCFIPATKNYFFRKFDATNLSVSTGVNLVGTSFASVTDNKPQVYADFGFVYVTNGMNANSNSNSFSKLNYNPTNNTLSLVLSFNVESTFVKTTNAVIKNNNIIIFINANILSYSLATQTVTNLGFYYSVFGNIFNLDGNIYFTSGDVATAWTL